MNSRLKLAHHRVICCICNTGSGSADKALGIVIFGRIMNAFGFAFISAGALGNSLDRLRLGAVDLFDASKPRFVWVFNVADVDLGIALILLAALLPLSEFAKSSTATIAHLRPERVNSKGRTGVGQ